jgi:hypothetical protein
MSLGLCSCIVVACCSAKDCIPNLLSKIPQIFNDRDDDSIYNSVLEDLQNSSETIDTIIAQMLDWNPNRRPKADLVAKSLPNKG